MTRIFLYIIAAIVGVVILGAALLTVFWDEAQQFAMAQMIPDMPYADATLPPAPDYGAAESWLARPGQDAEARLTPEGVEPPSSLPVDAFFIHPTTYLKSVYWNAPIDEPSATAMLPRVLAAQATPFAAAERIFAPRYRQAAFGAFMAANGDTLAALLTAYADVERAFDRYIEEENQGRPFLLVGHSQGAILGMWLLKNRIAGTSLADRMVAAYLPGWTFSIEEDLGALLGIEPCATPQMTGCVLSWQSFAADGDTRTMRHAFETQFGLSGRLKSGSAMLCVNPISFLMNEEPVPASLHQGSVATRDQGGLTAPKSGMLTARCDEQGFLRVDPAPGDPFNALLMPGGNYHVYDIHLFHMDIRADVARRAGRHLAKGQAG